MTRRREEHYPPAPLFAALDDSGRTMKWLAKNAGFSRNYLQLIRAGRKPLTKPVAEKACEAMGLDLASLFLPGEPREGAISPPILRSEAA